MHPTVQGVVGGVLSHATSWQLHLTQVIAIGPDEAGQPIHRDQWAFDFFPFPSGFEVQCNTIWAMNDFTEANGATRVIPGSNKLEDRLEFTPGQTEAAEMRRARCCSTRARFTTAAARTARRTSATDSTSRTH